MAKMTKKELVAATSAAVESSSGRAVPQTTVALVLDALIGVVSDAVCAGDDVAIRGLVSFKTVEVPAKKGRNPRTGEAIDIPAKTKIKAKSGIKSE